MVFLNFKHFKLFSILINGILGHKFMRSYDSMWNMKYGVDGGGKLETTLESVGNYFCES